MSEKLAEDCSECGSVNLIAERREIDPKLCFYVVLCLDCEKENDHYPTLAELQKDYSIIAFPPSPPDQYIDSEEDFGA